MLNEFHIGKKIEKVWIDSGLTKKEFGELIDIKPQNINGLFTRKTIDSELLLLISKVLKCNFFNYYSEMLDGIQLPKKEVLISNNELLIEYKLQLEAWRELYFSYKQLKENGK